MNRLNKKIILLSSVESPFWRQRLKTVTRAKIAQILGVAQNTLNNWEIGGGVEDSTLQRSFDEMRVRMPSELNNPQDEATLSEIITTLYDRLIDEAVGVYEFGDFLGFSRIECQRAIDRGIFKRRPVFQGIYYENTPSNLQQLDEDFETYKGCYRIYIERPHRILQGALRVRYPLHLKALWTIRAKLNLPRYVAALGKQRDYFEYDGFLSVKHDVVFWMFEERRRSHGDFFQIITERPDMLEGYRAAQGQHLTTRRTKGNEIVSGRVALEHVSLEDDEVPKFMHTSPTIITDQDFDVIWSRINVPISSVDM